MHNVDENYPQAKPVLYAMLAGQMRALLKGERNLIANLANASALLNTALSDINWVGFYLMTEGDLVLGPFQGRIACVRIAMGKGVCGTVAAQDATQLVYDVHRFPDHIACDSDSNSEIVIPLHHAGRVAGVLDIDSPLVGRFDEQDRAGLEKIAHEIEQACWS
ncbi:MAG TPA: GAF domain-containing protein [Clostridia bacterium]|nr:GAF domain-containing protein [Clostridia bacterium]